MPTPADPLSLADWRRAVSQIYADVRRQAASDPEAAWLAFRASRDELFRSHPQSPLDASRQAAFSGLPYMAYDVAWRIRACVDKDVPMETFRLSLSSDGDFYYTRVAKVRFTVKGGAAQLSLFWVEGYGGGLFLPFKDATNGWQTFGGGRYLYDTIKGADQGVSADHILLDFNFAYNPSCAYDSSWICPLSPPENRLLVPVEAGEMSGSFV
jgi:uncharacterized protein (DUF1684 family)